MGDILSKVREWTSADLDLILKVGKKNNKILEKSVGGYRFWKKNCKFVFL